MTFRDGPILGVVPAEPLRTEIIGNATLYLADCRDILPTIQKTDVCITDPPYGVGLGIKKDMRRKGHGLGKLAYASGREDTLQDFRDEVVPAIKLAIEKTTRAAVFCTYNLHELPKPDAIGGIYLPAAMGRHCWGFNSLIAIGFYGKAPDLNLGSKATVLRSTERAPKDVAHPCPKPLGWMTWLVGLASRKGETILDPFMGSGTTGVAALQERRKFIGIERDPAYFEVACQRIEGVVRKRGDE